jgi:hypothetical protein
MRETITQNDLQNLFSVFARKCGVGTQVLKDGQLNIGAWKLDYSQGGVLIVEVKDEIGTLVPVFSGGPTSKLELFNRIQFTLETLKLLNPTEVKRR